MVDIYDHALFYLDTHQAQSVVTGKEFWLPFSIVKLLKADTAVGQVVAFLFHCFHLAVSHSVLSAIKINRERINNLHALKCSFKPVISLRTIKQLYTLYDNLPAI